MKFTQIGASAFLVATSTWGAHGARTERQLKDKDEPAPAPATICASCELETFYYYVEQTDGEFLHHAIFTEPDDELPIARPGSCTLAAIRDDESRRAAQYAIPDGKIALTQGYFPIEDYVGDCHFEDFKDDEGKVASCGKHYESYFVNYEGTLVPSDPTCWDVPAYPFEDGAVKLGIGADGLLRPVQVWKDGSAGSEANNFGYDGAIYECCPISESVCNEVA